MNELHTNNLSPPVLSQSVFNRLGAFIHTRFGIKMPDSKRVMIESRLRKRLKVLNIKSYAEYCDFLFSDDGLDSELHHFIDVVTTNKTDFFRNPNHFRFLTNKALPQLVKSGAGTKRALNVWSSACSQGDEPYTIAIVMSEFARNSETFDFSILATDISKKVLEVAQHGIYPHNHIETIPLDLRRKYLLKSKDKNKDLVRIVPELRKKVTFRHLNLIEKTFRVQRTMDIIFCRNVIIYFDQQTTDDLIKKLCGQLKKGGFLFMGHSELLDCSNLPIVQTAPTIYQKI